MNRFGWIISGTVIIVLGGLLIWMNLSARNEIPSTDVYVDNIKAPSMHTLTEVDTGSTVQLRLGESLSVQLDTHSDGGYIWNLDSYDTAILTLDSDQTVPPETLKNARGEMAVGASADERWTFTAKTPGTTTIQLTNYRPWETKPTTPTFSLTVTVN